MPTITFDTDPGTSTDPDAGDAHVVSGVDPNIFGAGQVTGWVGRAAKNNGEVNIFRRFDLGSGITPDLPIGSRIDGVNFRHTTSSAATSGGTYRIGYLRAAAGGSVSPLWETRGFFQATPDDYPQAYNFTSPAAAPPHATRNNSIFVEPNRILLNAWSSPAITWLGIGAEVTLNIGDGIGGEDTTATLIKSNFEALFNGNGVTVLGITLDSQNVSNGDDRLKLYNNDTATAASRPKLIVEYTENPPTIDSTSPTDGGEEGHLFTYAPASTTYSLGDQTNGAFLDQAWTITGEPAGMVIAPTTGVVTWTPSIGQRGVHTFTIRLTNAGGLFAEQTITLTVSKVGRGAKVVSITGEPAVVATSIASPAVDAEAIGGSAITIAGSSSEPVVILPDDSVGVE